MAKYRVEFDNKQLKSVNRTEQEMPSNDTFLEERTGETIWAIIEASDDSEAQEKAQRLEEELQTRRTKENLRGDNSNKDQQG